MELLFLFEVGVELGDTLQCQFFCQANVVRLFNVLVRELFDLGRVSGTEKLDLLLFGHDLDDLLNDIFKVS